MGVVADVEGAGLETATDIGPGVDEGTTSLVATIAAVVALLPWRFWEVVVATSREVVAQFTICYK